MSRKVLSFATFGLLSFVPGKVGKVLRGAVLTAAGFITGQPGLIAAGLGMVAGAFAGKPKVSPSTIDRLNASLVPDKTRDMVLGKTAMATEVRYEGYTGDDQEYVHWIMAVAAHECQSVDEIWFDTKKAWDSASGVTSDFAGYLDVDVRNPGTSGNGIGIDSVWTSTATLTGCTYLHLRFKRTGNSKKAESPFSSSIPTRVTVRGRGALLPDIREPGCDANDQSTWDWFDDDSGRNPALQLLFYLIGWRINGKLSVGRGIPVNRIDLDSFITAANFCDEPVTLAAGGTEPRYRCDGVFSEGDDPGLVIGNLTGAMNAVIRDDGGKLSVVCLHNNLSTPVAAFTHSDIIGDENWMQTSAVDEYFNVVRGKYTDPSDAGLYQLVDYPEIEIDSIDGIERPDPFDLATVQSASQAQRLAKGRLQRNLYRGVYSAKFNERAWQVSLGDIVTLSHISLGWEEKLFRVVGHGIALTGIVTMTLQEEHEDIYAWDADESPAVVAAVPTAYEPLNDPFVLGLQEIDEALDPLLDAAESAADDNVLTIREKIDAVIPTVAALDARYLWLTARADDLGISTASVDASRTAFLDNLAGMSPAYDDITQDTVLSVNLVDPAIPNGWTVDNGATTTANDIYRTIADPTSALGEAYHAFPTTGGQTYTIGVVVKKDATGKATRAPMFRLINANGTARNADVHADTATGEASASGSTGFQGGGCFSLNDTEWLVFVALTVAANTTQAILVIFPAFGTNFGFNAATTGSIDVRDPVAALGGFDHLGRDAYRFRLKDYGYWMDALAKSISEVDGVTSLQIDGDAVINIAATSDGDASASLPTNRSYTARSGAGTVIGSWSVTTISGTITCSIGASTGVLQITALGSPTAKLRIDVTYGGAAQSMTVQVNRNDAPPSGGGGGGTGGTTDASISTSISSTSYSVIATVTQTVGSTGPVLSTPSLILDPIDLGGGDGTWNVEFQWVRENGVTDVNVGSAANSSPDPAISGGVTISGYASVPATDSGRTIGVSYTYYLMAKLSSGSQPISISGTARGVS